MVKFQSIFSVDKPVVGMVHLQALPGTPKYSGSVDFVIDTALKEAELYKQAGIDALAIENMHDVPYLKNEVGPEVGSLMAVIGRAIKNLTDLPCGIQVLSSANKTALAIANSAGLDFVRAEGFVFGHLADEGYIDACAGSLLRYRKAIGAEHIAVFTDIKKKHSSHSISADTSVLETAKAAEYFLSDGVILTGGTTGEEASWQESEAVKKACKIPVIIGSGISIDNLQKYLPVCDAMIVGSHFKKNGHWAEALDYNKINRFMDEKNQLMH